MDKQPLGMRNNNPLNIRKSTQRYVGEVVSDNAFKKFKSISYGTRAAIRILSTYYHKYNLHTAWNIIHRWAPSNENNTISYIDIVCKRCNLQRDTIIKWDEKSVLSLVKAMAYVECHVELSDKDLQEGWTLAQSN